MKKLLLALTLTATIFYGCSSSPRKASDENTLYYEKVVAFPPEATLEEKIDMAARLIPTPQQLEWQKMELTAFLHFGINTFTGREWGDGKESPALFNPTDFDADQWVKVLKDAGFKMAIITAKHHDGFCLWPTLTTTHSVASSPWKNGKGDIVKELKEACDRHGMNFGVYLSPWDRNAASYGTPQYNDLFVAQLTELLTNYGEVYEVWFDGANGEGPNGKRQEYDWERYMKLIRKLQPQAVTAIKGEDVRWVGNEKGLGRETEWSATVLNPYPYPTPYTSREELGISSMSKDLGSRELLEKTDYLFWYPSEVDVSIRPGWFYHTEQDDKVKSLSHLVDIYFKSVGYNSVLLLNIPPDTRGLINEADAGRIKELAAYLKEAFKTNLVVKGDQPWQAATGESKEYKLAKGARINTLLLQEDIARGQRAESFKVEIYRNNQWHEIATGTTIGYKRLLRIDETEGEKLRLTILQSRLKTNISNFSAYQAPPIESNRKKMVINEMTTTDWKIVSPATADKSIIDGNTETSWKSNDLSPIVIDLGKATDITGFTYTPVTVNDKAGTIFTYNFYISPDGKNWTKCDLPGEFSNIKNNPVTQFVYLKQKSNARYIKLEPLSETDGNNFITVAEIGVLVNSKK